MIWQIRLMICGGIAVCMMAVVSGGRSKSLHSQPSAEPRTSTQLAVGEDSFQRPTVDPAAYSDDKILGQNLTVTSPAPAAVTPMEDLLLKGFSGVGSNRCALFTITQPSETDSCFALHEGEQNDWLEVLSIDPPNGRVRAILKRPVVRARMTGTELVLSFNTHGKRNF